MTLTNLKTILDSTGFPVAYQVFPEAEVPDMPFICYSETSTDNFGADGKAYHVIRRAEIQLFTDKKDLEAEANVEEALESLYWQKTDEFNDDEHCYRVIYQITL